MRLRDKERHAPSIQPRLFYDPDGGSVPELVGWILGRLKAHDFLEMRVSEVPETGARARTVPIGPS